MFRSVRNGFVVNRRFDKFRPPLESRGQGGAGTANQAEKQDPEQRRKQAEEGGKVQRNPEPGCLSPQKDTRSKPRSFFFPSNDHNSAPVAPRLFFFLRKAWAWQVGEAGCCGCLPLVSLVFGLGLGIWAFGLQGNQNSTGRLIVCRSWWPFGFGAFQTSFLLGQYRSRFHLGFSRAQRVMFKRNKPPTSFAQQIPPPFWEC